MKKIDAPMTCSPPKHAASQANWIIDDGSRSLLESKFARTIAAKSRGKWENLPEKLYEPFKVTFMEEPRYNPGLSNAHISNEYDAHFIDADYHWSHSGNKFCSEERFTRPNLLGCALKLKSHVSNMSFVIMLLILCRPAKADAVPYTFDKPMKMFGRARKSEIFEI